MAEHNNKYELVEDDTKTVNGETLTRIRSLKNFSFPYQGQGFPALTVKKGDLGGYVAGLWNLEQTGKAWISENSMAGGMSCVGGHALAQNETVLMDDAQLNGRSRVSNVQMLDSSTIDGDSMVRVKVLTGNDSIINNDYQHVPSENQTDPGNPSQGRSEQTYSDPSNPYSTFGGNEAVITLATSSGVEAPYTRIDKECGSIRDNDDGSSTVYLDHDMIKDANVVGASENDPKAYDGLATAIRGHFEKRFENEGYLPEKVHTQWRNPDEKAPIPMTSVMAGDNLVFMPYTANQIKDFADAEPIIQDSQSTSQIRVYDLRGFDKPSFSAEVPSGDEVGENHFTMMVLTKENADLSNFKFFSPEGDVPRRLNFVFNTQDIEATKPMNEGVIKEFPDMKPIISRSGDNTNVSLMGKDLLEPEKLHRQVGGPIGHLGLPSSTSMAAMKDYAKKSPDAIARTISNTHVTSGPESGTVQWNELAGRKQKQSIERNHPDQMSLAF